jgi:threonine dehydrogenase-like Zn-dependent dehydrogenase
MSSRNATRIDFERVIDCLKKGFINPSNYITHRVKFNAVKENFDSWLNPSTGVIKAMIEIE